MKVDRVISAQCPNLCEVDLLRENEDGSSMRKELVEMKEKGKKVDHGVIMRLQIKYDLTGTLRNLEIGEALKTECCCSPGLAPGLRAPGLGPWPWASVTPARPPPPAPGPGPGPGKGS